MRIEVGVGRVFLLFLIVLGLSSVTLVYAEEFCFYKTQTHEMVTATAEICTEFDYDRFIEPTDFIRFRCNSGDLYINTNPATCDDMGCEGRIYAIQGQDYDYYLTEQPVNVYALCHKREEFVTPLNQDLYYAWVYIDVEWSGLLYGDPNAGQNVVTTTTTTTEPNIINPIPAIITPTEPTTSTTTQYTPTSSGTAISTTLLVGGGVLLFVIGLIIVGSIALIIIWVRKRT